MPIDKPTWGPAGSVALHYNEQLAEGVSESWYARRTKQVPPIGLDMTAELSRFKVIQHDGPMECYFDYNDLIGCVPVLDNDYSPLREDAKWQSGMAGSSLIAYNMAGGDCAHKHYFFNAKTNELFCVYDDGEGGPFVDRYIVAPIA